MKALRWCSEEVTVGVSAIELAVDFECHTGRSLGGDLHSALYLPSKARKIKDLMSRMQSAWVERTGAPFFPGEPLRTVHSLRCIGRDNVIGFSRRPVFASGETVAKLMELKKAFRRERTSRLKRRLGDRPGTTRYPQKDLTKKRGGPKELRKKLRGKPGTVEQPQKGGINR